MKGGLTMRTGSTSLAAVVAAGAVVALLAGAAVGARSHATRLYTIRATMTPKLATPPSAGAVSKARATLSGHVTVAKRSVVGWRLTYSGMTGRVVAAFVRYRNAKGVKTSISLCTKRCKTGLESFTFFPSKAQGAYFVAQIRKRKVDSILTTKRNQLGEVRGVLRARASG